MGDDVTQHEDVDVDEKTKIPFWWVAVAVPVFSAACFWLASVQVEAHEAKQRVEKIESVLYEMRDRLIRVEDKIDKGH